MRSSAEKNQALYHKASEALARGEARDAHQICLQILSAEPQHAGAFFLCGVIAGNNGKKEKAAEILARAVAIEPDNSRYVAEFAKYLLACGQQQEALRQAGRARLLTPADASTLDTLGTVLSHCGEHENALACFEAAYERMNERHPTAFRSEALFNFAASLQFAGRFEEAERRYEDAIELAPDFYRAHFALASLRKQTPHDNHIARLRDLQSTVHDPIARLHVGHALAKELEDTGQYDESLQVLIWAKSGQADRVGYNFSRDREIFDTVRALPADTAASNGCSSDEPIFIVGMPRTGTTLLERILGNHPQVFAAGELQNFPLMVKGLGLKGLGPGEDSSEILDADILRRANDIDPLTLGEAYLESTRPRTGHTAHFIDKLPLNMLYLGLIRRALPNARLICLRRDPMDTCLSNYRQLFATNFRSYYYSYDLLNCGRYYVEFDRLMAHWSAQLSGGLLEIQYERLVQDPVAVTHELLAFCGLPWDDACLTFYEDKTSVATPSAVQVRQRIYQTSVERWRRYGNALDPLRALLEEAGCYD